MILELQERLFGEFGIFHLMVAWDDGPPCNRTECLLFAGIILLWPPFWAWVFYLMATGK